MTINNLMMSVDMWSDTKIDVPVTDDAGAHIGFRVDRRRKSQKFEGSILREFLIDSDRIDEFHRKDSRVE